MAKRTKTVELNLPNVASTVSLDASSAPSVLADSDQTAFFTWASSPDDGVTVTSPSFTGPQNVSVTTTENYGPSRNKTLQFVVVADPSKVATLSINQAGNTLSLAPVSLDFAVNGSTQDVVVTSAISDASLITCIISENAQSWLSVVKDGRTFHFTALSNTGSGSSRSGMVTFISGNADGVHLSQDLPVSQASDTSPVYGNWELNGGIVESATALPASGGTLTWKVGMPYRSVSWASGAVTTQYAYQDSTASANGSVILNDASSASNVFTFSWGSLGPADTISIPVGTSVWDSPDGSNAGGYRLVTITCASAGNVVSDVVTGAFNAELQGSGISGSATLHGAATRAANAIVNRVFGNVDWVSIGWSGNIPASNSSTRITVIVPYVDTYTSGSTRNGSSDADEVSIKAVVGSDPLSGVTLTNVQEVSGQLGGTLSVPYNPNDATRSIVFTMLAKDKDGSTFVEVSPSQTLTQDAGYIGSFSGGDTYDLPNATSSQTHLSTSFPASALTATLEEGVDYYSVSFTDGTDGVDVHFNDIQSNNTGSSRTSTLVIKGE